MTSLTHDEEQTEAAPFAGLLGAIRAQSHQLAKDQTIDIPIAGYKRPDLVARYRFLEHDEVREIGNRIRNDERHDDDIDRAEAALINVMIEACLGLYAREGDKLEPVELPDDGGPCRYDGRLETFFGGEPSGSAREAVLRAFKGNWLAAINHGRLLQEWLTDTSKTIEQLLGEA